MMEVALAPHVDLVGIEPAVDECLLRPIPIGDVPNFSPGDPDHDASVPNLMLGDQPVEGWDELALGQVACAAKDHKDVGVYLARHNSTTETTSPSLLTTPPATSRVRAKPATSSFQVKREATGSLPRTPADMASSSGVITHSW